MADVSRPDDIRRIFAFVEEKLGGSDLLHNNATIMTAHEVWLDAPPERLARVLAVNLAGVCMRTQAAVRSPLRGDGGSIVNTASTVALRPIHTDPVYAATKAGVVHLTRSRAHLSSSGIAVNAVLPGPGLTDTPLLSKTAPSAMAPALSSRSGDRWPFPQPSQSGRRIRVSSGKSRPPLDEGAPPGSKPGHTV